jgi:regulator of replication initiation timing
MSKHLTITISDWVFATYLSNIKINRSQYIEEMIVKGSELNSGDFEIIKQKILRLTQENRELSIEIAQLKKQIGCYKEKFGRSDNRDQRTLDLDKMAESMRIAGVLHNVGN